MKPSNQIPNKITEMCMISIGPQYGIIVLNGLVMAGNDIAKGKFEILHETKKIRNGDVA